MEIFGLLAPAVIVVILVTGAVRGVDIAAEFGKGAMEGLNTAIELLPVLLLVVTAVGFAYRSGALGALGELLEPILSRAGLCGDVVPLALVRPVSGSGALAVYSSIIGELGPDSFAGRAATVLMGSTETTFYTIAVYYAATSLKPGRGVFITSLTADAAGLIFSALTVRLFY